MSQFPERHAVLVEDVVILVVFNQVCGDHVVIDHVGSHRLALLLDKSFLLQFFLDGFSQDLIDVGVVVGRLGLLDYWFLFSFLHI